MVMIVKDHEKKAWGFISVTWITVRAHVSALPGRRGAAATVYTCGPAGRYGRRAHAVMHVPLVMVVEEARRRDYLAQ